MPKGLEIERRYLAKDCDISNFSAPPKRIVQGYFSDEPGASKRIRIIDDREAVLTIKRGQGLVREEIETPLELEEARTRLEGARAVIRKNRYKHEGWDVDFFDSPFGARERGYPLVVAERELKSARQKVVIPRWLGQVLEVTEILCTEWLAEFLLEASSYKPAAGLVATHNPKSKLGSVAEMVWPQDALRFTAYLEERLAQKTAMMP
ncbi:hypothetical protein HZC53_06080 [Candidatus Uhrbacteria bacterium]|nr:hypothetical protein [Candidatus Uhrbacteria bacterium]